MNIIKKISTIIIISISGTIFTGVMFFSVIYNLNNEVSATPALAEIGRDQSELQGHPRKLYIPSLKINASVEEVGITKNGNIASPRNFSGAGWYKYGPLPGKNGTAIIGGHVDNGLAFPAVFNKLSNIQIGDKIYVETKEKKTLNFVVESISVYDYNAPTENIITGDGTPRLILITCTGNLIPGLRTHDKRLVVMATLSS